MATHRILRASLTAAVIALASVTACDDRFGPSRGVIRLPGIEVPASAFGQYTLRQVDGEPLPHVTTRSGTDYSLVSGSFTLRSDSTWQYANVTTQPGPNGTTYVSPASYNGRWAASDTAIELTTPASGYIRMKGDTLIWVGGPRFSWEPPLSFTLVRP